MGSRAERDPVFGEEGKTMCMLRLRKVDFIDHGITGGFTGCQALISGTARGHSKACRERMNEEQIGGSKRRTRRWPNTRRRCSECRTRRVSARRRECRRKKPQEPARVQADRKRHHENSKMMLKMGLQVPVGRTWHRSPREEFKSAEV